MHVLHIIVSEKSASRPLFTLSATPYGRPGSKGMEMWPDCPRDPPATAVVQWRDLLHKH